MCAISPSNLTRHLYKNSRWDGAVRYSENWETNMAENVHNYLQWCKWTYTVAFIAIGSKYFQNYVLKRTQNENSTLKLSTHQEYWLISTETSNMPQLKRAHDTAVLRTNTSHQLVLRSSGHHAIYSHCAVSPGAPTHPVLLLDSSPFLTRHAMVLPFAVWRDTVT